MAKKRKKTQTRLAYEKQEKRIKQFIRRAEKRGYMFEEDIIPQRPSRYTKARVQELERLTPQELYKHAIYYAPESGYEFIPGEIGKKAEDIYRAHKAAETRKANKEAERRFWTQEDAEERRSRLPIGGKTIYKNVLDEFISKLSAPTANYTPDGKKRFGQSLYESERQKKSLYDLVMQVVARDGEETVGWRIQSDDDLDAYLTYVMYGSRAELIQTASAHIAEVIQGTALGNLDMRDLAEESENEESWELPE